MAKKPTGAALHAAILLAAGDLDAQDPNHFTRDGRPQVAALNERLGYRITAAERDAAVAAPKKKATVRPARPKARSTRSRAWAVL